MNMLAASKMFPHHVLFPNGRMAGTQIHQCCVAQRAYTKVSLYFLRKAYVLYLIMLTNDMVRDMAVFYQSQALVAPMFV